jgi:hypothetical protein
LTTAGVVSPFLFVVVRGEVVVHTPEADPGGLE